jgi:hypothetical protein
MSFARSWDCPRGGDSLQTCEDDKPFGARINFGSNCSDYDSHDVYLPLRTSIDKTLLCRSGGAVPVGNLRAGPEFHIALLPDDLEHTAKILQPVRRTHNVRMS